MIIIQHRVNQIEQLKKVPKKFGVEVDVRSIGSELYLSHDPFLDGDKFSDYLSSFNHAYLVLNVKEDGLEDACLELLSRYQIKNYFFLDQPIPSFVRRGLRGSRDGAARMSEYELFPSLRMQAELCEWLWLDFFFAPNLDPSLLAEIREIGLKICLVSPELHSLDRAGETEALIALLELTGNQPDAVCTKFPELWGRLAN